MKAKAWIASFVTGLALLLAGCAGAISPPQAASADPTKAQLTVLYDAFGKPSAMQKDWGYSVFIEYGGRRILFDTGNNSDILAQNAKAKGVNLSKLDFVVMSHRHGDHIGGLAYLLSVNPKVRIYAPKEGFGVYGADLPSSFYRKDESLPPEQRYYDGKPPEVMRFGAAWPGANFQLVDKNTEIVPGIHLIALVSDKPGTLELRELSLVIDAPDGLLIVVGCSHPGIEKIVATAIAINPRVHLIAGGFHLVVSTDPDIEKIVTSLRDTYKVEYVAPGHCTGEPTFTALKKAFGDRYLYAGLGTTFALGATPKAMAEADQKAPTTMGADDLKSYRRLLEKSDDHEPVLLARRSSLAWPTSTVISLRADWSDGP
jgi:7,8-dihydropterin-6-yl-methyl-4-(beta-D-ribofuranosyl)aminobenzene 5'-phosphate synthase